MAALTTHSSKIKTSLNGVRAPPIFEFHHRKAMPQGKKDLSSGPKKERYARKPEEERHAFHTLIAPKSTVAASSTNQGYVAILPTIRKNAQMIAAGKLAANGSVLRTGELARLADEQIKLLAKKRQQVRHWTFLWPFFFWFWLGEG